MTNTKKMFLALGLAAVGALPLLAMAVDRANAGPAANPRPSAAELLPHG